MNFSFRRYGRLLFLALPLLFLLCACSEEEPVVVVDLEKRSDFVAPAPDRFITYSYLPQYSHQVSYQRHRLLVEYLSRATGLPLRQVFPDTFDEHEKMVHRGEIDISFSNPFVYVRMAGRGVRAFARVVEESGRPDFYSQIIVRADNKLLRNLEDCRGKRWIAVDQTSAGGYLFALGHFLNAGIRYEDFAEIAFAPGPGGKQEKVALAVYSGIFDLGSVRNGTLELLANRIDLGQLRVLDESRRYPGWVYAARPGLDRQVVAAVAEALFALNSGQHGEILAAARFQKVIPSSDDDYQSIRELQEKLGLP